MLATGLKQLPSVIDTMLMPDVWEIFEQWDEWPPEHVLLHGFVGWKAPEKATTSPEAVADLAKHLGAPQKAPAYVLELVRMAEQMKGKLHGDSRN
jgi:hypothetical protein